MDRYGQNDSDGDQVDQLEGPTVTEEGKRDTGNGHDADRHSDIFKDMK